MTVDASLSSIHLITFDTSTVPSLYLFIFIIFKGFIFFKAISVLQQNWEESTDFLKSPVPTHAQSPPLPSLLTGLSTLPVGIFKIQELQRNLGFFQQTLQWQILFSFTIHFEIPTIRQNDVLKFPDISSLQLISLTFSMFS